VRFGSSRISSKSNVKMLKDSTINFFLMIGLKINNSKFVLSIFFIKTFLFEQDDPLEKHYSIMDKVIFFSS
jgi:hypothetical protein